MLPLPTELVIEIVQYLPVSTISSLSCTSREWHKFCQVNESILYHNAAVLHGFIPSTSIIYSDLGTVLSARSLTGVTDWKSFCYTQICFQKSWRGEAPAFVTEHRCAGTDVHRIKVDEQRGFIIVTTSKGGLLVVDLHDDEVLWSLPESYVHPYAHCEYGAGYLIFDRGGPAGEKEVWRLVDDLETLQDCPTFAFPDEKQQNISAAADYPARGHFRPWAVLKPPALTRAFRFVYPTLIAATLVSLFLWDIRTGELVQTIQDTQISSEGVGSTEHLGDTNYVEVSAQTDGHAFICGSNTLRVFSRTTGRCVLDVPSSQFSYGKNTYSFLPVGNGPSPPSFVLKPQHTDHHIASMPNDNSRLIDEFIAVHVSACGRHLAALLASSRLIIVPFFQRIINGDVDIWDIALDIQLGSPASVARYLAFENGRIAIATGTGLFVVAPDWESSLDPPRISVHRAAWFNAPLSLSCVSCLQMTPTGIFLTWDAGILSNGERFYKGEDLRPEPGFDALFFRSLNEEQSLLHLPNGDHVIQLFEPGLPGHGETDSSVFSIDFIPMEAT
ncbi:hypothetical protein DFH06DRAFT_308677 [Mycena polygramma]|nr:hypothetical protein DFH06DRAFT_308677 [Mycena polygramma]